MKKRDTCLIFGGMCEEYEVSLRSAFFVLEGLDPSLFDVTLIGITRDGKWYYYEGDPAKIPSDKWQNEENESVVLDLSRGCFIKHGREYLPDIIFPALHGKHYEDGALGGMLEMLGIPYVGSGSLSSRLCFNKHLTKASARALGISCARDVLVDKSCLDSFFETICNANKLSYPLFVKPCTSGSSFGITKVYKPCLLYEAVKTALAFSKHVLIEEHITGAECEIVIYQKNNALLASSVGKIVHSSDFYDYETKYFSAENEYEIPAKIPNESEILITKYAKKLFCALSCKDYARFDFFVTDGGEVIFNEVNTLPGLTKSSMLPMLLSQKGVNSRELITLLMNNNLK